MGKKARGAKSVLSKQEIFNRRKALTDKKLTTDHAGRRALMAVFTLASATLGLLSLASWDAHDRVGPGFRNAVGPVGHAVAEMLKGAFGVCSYVGPFALLYVACIIIFGEKGQRRWPQFVSLALLTLSCSILAQLYLGPTPLGGHPAGGEVGRALGGFLSALFSTVGTVVLVTALAMAALIIGTQYTFLRLCALAYQGATALGGNAYTYGLSVLDQQKRALEERRAQAEKEKVEEAAFLAQLEADEEELSAAEEDAIAAAAAEEEAHRLAQEDEARKAEKLAAKLEREDKRGKKAQVAEVQALAAADLATPLPGADPAWAMTLAPPQNNNATVANGGASKKKKGPNIVTAGPAGSQPPAAMGGLAPSLVPTPAEALAGALEPIPLTALAGAPVAAAAAGAGTTALATTTGNRMPLIVEPKVPPKPTSKKERKETEEFEFVGNRKSFTPPGLDILECDKVERTALDKEAFLSTAEKLRAKLADFGIVGEVVEIRPGPVVTMYEFLPGPGIKVSKIASLSDDLAMAMEAMRVRIVAPIPGKGVVGIEVPNRDRETVYLKEIVEQDLFQKSASKLTMCVGKDIEGMPVVFDLAKAPHLLMAGTTGSGKSVAVNSMIMSILLKATPEEVRFIMVDPKMLELSIYEGIPHLLLPVVTDPKKAALALRWAVEEMERRYHVMSEVKVRNIAGYNKFVETQLAAAPKMLERVPEKIVKGSLPAPAEVSALERREPAPEKNAKPAKKKMMVIDVADGESEEQALERAIASPTDEVGVPRETEGDATESVELKPFEAEIESVAERAGPPMEVIEAIADAGAPYVEGEPADAEKKELRKLPYIVVIIDELADLMMVASREVETYIARLAQMARAAGIHLMVATQRPSTDVVTGVIKANFPSRITFMLRSKPDSMTILGTIGAEALLGMGDMLIMPPTSAHLQRVHGAYVSEAEIKRAVDHLKAQGKPVFDESILRAREEDSEGGAQEDELSDELWDQALATVSEMRQVSISMLQRKMRIGYNRAARMIERMEREGIVGPADGAKPREVLLRQVGEMPGAGAM
jgi:DNA segregation ATPase FtsK/SpoIIIE, S-DNA-T family